MGGEYKSRLQITREEKAKGKHHTQKKETFAGAPTLAGAAEVGTAFAKSSVDDSGAETKWTFRIPILADFGGQRVGDIFGDEVRGLHSTYNNKIKKQIEKSSKEKRKTETTSARKWDITQRVRNDQDLDPMRGFNSYHPPPSALSMHLVFLHPQDTHYHS